MANLNGKYDVLVATGNAALCAAVGARREGSPVLVAASAPKFWRGDNTRHARNIRCAHDAAIDTLSGPYPEEEFFKGRLQITRIVDRGDRRAIPTRCWRATSTNRSVRCNVEGLT